ncbi:MAG: hypothetical protein A2W33_01235 [Chloroflexi bacterium RBG_16_52_11]|nr:MAG: hypothetical protein A2W33_01235 [Chloroflexi bacterium RBG_16_52_11]
MVKHPAVEVHLATETPQAITIRLDLVSMQKAVHDREINPHLPATNPEFFDDNCFSIMSVFGLKVGA